MQLDAFTIQLTHPCSDHFHTDAVVPSRDHCRTETVLPPSDHYCIETVAPSGDHSCIDIAVPSSDHCCELKMLRFSVGVTRMDKIRNEYIRGTAQVGTFGEKTREARLRWYGHLRRKDDGYIGRRMLMMVLPVQKEETGKAKKEVYGCGERGHG